MTLGTAMSDFPANQRLTETDLERLDEFLRSYKGGKAMNVEEVDGFFAALIAGPEIVTPSEYMREVFDSEMPETHAFSTLAEAHEILGLLTRHWNDIAGTLLKGDLYLPLLLDDEDGVRHGSDWARGFIRGTRLRHDGWAELLADDDCGGCMIPMMMLYHEHDEDPALRPKPIGPEQREKVIVSVAAGLLGAYRYFRRHKQLHATTRVPEPRHNNVEIGRNDPCPCGSGKKYKRCCGNATIH